MSSRVMVTLDPGCENVEPGALISGTVRWEDEGVDHTLMISLVWFTSGRGTEDIEVAHQQEVDASAASGEASFQLDAPAFPWSFSGTLITLNWAVEASLEPGGAVDRADVVIAPDGTEVLL